MAEQSKAAINNNLSRIRRVLVVDDNANNRLIVRDMLNQQHIEVQQASNGIEALQLLQQYAYDAIVMDYHMPYMDGLQVIRHIRNDLRLIKERARIVLLHSSSDEQYVAKECAELGVEVRIVKPIKSYQLFSALSRLYAQDPAPPVLTGITGFMEFVVPSQGNGGQGAEPPQDRANSVQVPQSTVILPDAPKGGGKVTDAIRLNQTPLPSIRILITEDNPVNMMLARAILEGFLPAGTTIYEAVNGQEGVAQFIKHRPHFILSDVQMPVMSGHDATKAIRAYEKEHGLHRTPIIALTAGTIKGERERCAEAGMDDYITKPVVASTIEQMLEKWLYPQFQQAHEKDLIDQGTSNSMLDGQSSSNGMEKSDIDIREHFDPENLMKQFSGYASLFERSLEVFKVEVIEKMPQLLYSALQLEDREQVRFWAHRTKGSAASMECTILRNLCAELEEIIANHPETAMTVIQEHVQAIIAEIEILRGILQNNEAVLVR